jgi:guanine deaminase
MPTCDDQQYMRMALEACRRGIEAGQSPFGACIVRTEAGRSRVLACTHNHVWLNRDATAHAEIMAIRDACRTVGDVHLAGADIYSTTEPCPMCFTAIHWARIRRIVFAARIEDAAQFGFNELPIGNATLKQLGRSEVELVGDFLRDEAVDLFRQWRQAGGRAY